MSENKTINLEGELSGPVNRWDFVRPGFFSISDGVPDSVLQLPCPNHICTDVFVLGEQEEVIGGAETSSSVRAASFFKSRNHQSAATPTYFVPFWRLNS